MVVTPQGGLMGAHERGHEHAQKTHLRIAAAVRITRVCVKVTHTRAGVLGARAAEGKQDAGGGPEAKGLEARACTTQAACSCTVE